MKRLHEPTSSDLAKWRRLAREAGRAAASLGQGQEPSLGDLRAATEAARKACVVGELTKASPFIRLVRTAQRVSAETVAGRRALADELGVLARTCAEIVDRPRAPGRLPYGDA